MSKFSDQVVKSVCDYFNKYNMNQHGIQVGMCQGYPKMGNEDRAVFVVSDVACDPSGGHHTVAVIEASFANQRLFLLNMVSSHSDALAIVEEHMYILECALHQVTGEFSAALTGSN